MFADYQEEVLRDYQIKKAANQLPLKLIHTTAAKLRTESIRVCEDRYQRKDENILSSLFGQQENAEGYRQAIKKKDSDWFKPLDNFLKGITKSTDEENIELLAWLIDFEPRPYQIGYNYKKNDAETAVEGKPIMPAPAPVSIKQPAGEKPAKKNRNIFLFVTLLFALGIVTYLIWPRKQNGCMYWTGNRYERTSCDEPRGSALIVPFNTFQFTHQQRITDTGTITKNSVGHVWYFRSGKQIECYTAPGPYPPDTNRRLLPLTQYIIHEYSTVNIPCQKRIGFILIFE